MEKSVLDIICASLDSFFESERKIGTYIIQISEKGIEEEEVSNHISVNDIEQSLKNILANKVTEITQTVSMMDAKQLSEILNKLNIHH